MTLMMRSQAANPVLDSTAPLDPHAAAATVPVCATHAEGKSSLVPISAPLSASHSQLTTTRNATSPSTNKLILDYLLYLSIQSRLRQAQVELMEDSYAETAWTEAASRAERDKHAVESVVKGKPLPSPPSPPRKVTCRLCILSSHKAPYSDLDERLHLCQLANLVFGRFDSHHASEHVIAQQQQQQQPTIYRRFALRRNTHHHHHQQAASDGNPLFSYPIHPPFCRRHRCRRQTNAKQEDASCSCNSHCNAPTNIPGLTDAIPAFLKVSADLLRRNLDNAGEEAAPMVLGGQRVMGGGMPPRWYDLFLELLTQAAIESYLCDGQSGVEPIFEIFSFGDVEDEDEPDDQDEEDDDEDEEEEDDADNEDEEGGWGVSAADHHLLFPKTRTMFLFKTQRREREKEFLAVQSGDDLTAHFEKLAQRYPLETFERNINEFIHMVLDTTEKPALSEQGSSTSTEAALPQIYKFLADGSLLMPEIPEDDSTADTAEGAEEQQQHSLKRRVSVDEKDLPEPKRSR
ncbi:hypothetical protein BX666DRAFT_2026409 [Dichotomocladium elegans]|nr:hypothetical protein BX666DRAFT_2026409 [Dichotomocladium elegans]